MTSYALNLFDFSEYALFEPFCVSSHCKFIKRIQTEGKISRTNRTWTIQLDDYKFVWTDAGIKQNNEGTIPFGRIGHGDTAKIYKGDTIIGEFNGNTAVFNRDVADRVHPELPDGSQGNLVEFFVNLSDWLLWTGRAQMQAKEMQGGRSRKVRKGSSWVSTGRKATVKDGSKRTLYKNAAKPGDLRVKRFSLRNGKRTAIYVQPSTK